MKKILAFILALSMVLALSACGGSAAAPGNNTPSDAAPSDSAQEQAPVTIQMTYPPSANATTDLEMLNCILAAVWLPIRWHWIAL